MQVIFVLAGLLAAVTADFYSSRYDNFDIQPLLDNDRILLSYTKCFLDEGPCTPDAKDFKSALSDILEAIPESVENTCGKCTPKQKDLIRRVIRSMMDRHPDSWKRLVEKYDPNLTFRESFNHFIEEND